MKSGRMVLRIGFLDLPVRTRNKATTLLASIKTELKKGYSLRDLGLDAGSWGNVNLNVFLEHPKEHYLQIINGNPKANASQPDLVKQVSVLYAIFSKKKRPRKADGLKR